MTGSRWFAHRASPSFALFLSIYSALRDPCNANCTECRNRVENSYRRSPTKHQNISPSTPMGFPIDTFVRIVPPKLRTNFYVLLSVSRYFTFIVSEILNFLRFFFPFFFLLLESNQRFWNTYWSIHVSIGLDIEIRFQRWARR